MSVEDKFQTVEANIDQTKDDPEVDEITKAKLAACEMFLSRAKDSEDIDIQKQKVNQAINELDDARTEFVSNIKNNLNDLISELDEQL